MSPPVLWASVNSMPKCMQPSPIAAIATSAIKAACANTVLSLAEDGVEEIDAPADFEEKARRHTRTGRPPRATSPTPIILGNTESRKRPASTYLEPVRPKRQCFGPILSPTNATTSSSTQPKQISLAERWRDVRNYHPALRGTSIFRLDWSNMPMEIMWNLNPHRAMIERLRRFLPKVFFALINGDPFVFCFLRTHERDMFWRLWSATEPDICLDMFAWARLPLSLIPADFEFQFTATRLNCDTVLGQTSSSKFDTTEPLPTSVHVHNPIMLRPSRRLTLTVEHQPKKPYARVYPMRCTAALFRNSKEPEFIPAFPVSLAKRDQPPTDAEREPAAVSVSATPVPLPAPAATPTAPLTSEELAIIAREPVNNAIAEPIVDAFPTRIIKAVARVFSLDAIAEENEPMPLVEDENKVELDGSFYLNELVEDPTMTMSGNYPQPPAIPQSIADLKELLFEPPAIPWWHWLTGAVSEPGPTPAAPSMDTTMWSEDNFSDIIGPKRYKVWILPVAIADEPRCIEVVEGVCTQITGVWGQTPGSRNGAFYHLSLFGVECELFIINGMIWIRDVANRGGLWVNGSKIAYGGMAMVKSGDIIGVGTPTPLATEDSYVYKLYQDKKLPLVDTNINPGGVVFRAFIEPPKVDSSEHLLFRTTLGAYGKARDTVKATLTRKDKQLHQDFREECVRHVPKLSSTGRTSFGDEGEHATHSGPQPTGRAGAQPRRCEGMAAAGGCAGARIPGLQHCAACHNLAVSWIRPSTAPGLPGFHSVFRPGQKRRRSDEHTADESPFKRARTDPQPPPPPPPSPPPFMSTWDDLLNRDPPRIDSLRQCVWVTVLVNGRLEYVEIAVKEEFARMERAKAHYTEIIDLVKDIPSFWTDTPFFCRHAWYPPLAQRTLRAFQDKYHHYAPNEWLAVSRAKLLTEFSEGTKVAAREIRDAHIWSCRLGELWRAPLLNDIKIADITPEGINAFSKNRKNRLNAKCAMRVYNLRRYFETRRERLRITRSKDTMKNLKIEAWAGRMFEEMGMNKKYIRSYSEYALFDEAPQRAHHR